VFVAGGALGFYAGMSIDSKKIPEYNYSLWDKILHNEGQEIDFQYLGGSEWTKVCFLGPYNTNSKNLLGFSWDVTDYTGVLSSDGHNVIIFTNEKKVIDFYVQIRSHGDFHKMSGKCLPRENSKLLLIGKSHSFVQPKA
jgi:hypothetical protein